jgi:hypothetical protein
MRKYNQSMEATMKRTLLLLPILLIAITAAASAQVVESYPQAAFTARCWRTEEGNDYDSWMLFRVTRDYFVWEATSFDVTHSSVDVALTFTDTIYPLTWNTDVILYLNPYMNQVGGKIRRTWQGEHLATQVICITTSPEHGSWMSGIVKWSKCCHFRHNPTQCASGPRLICEPISVTVLIMTRCNTSTLYQSRLVAVTCPAPAHYRDHHNRAMATHTRTQHHRRRLIEVKNELYRNKIIYRMGC